MNALESFQRAIGEQRGRMRDVYGRAPGGHASLTFGWEERVDIVRAMSEAMPLDAREADDRLAEAAEIGGFR